MNEQAANIRRAGERLGAAVARQAGLSARIAGFRPEDAADIALSRVVSASLHDDDFVKEWLATTRRRATLRTKRIPLSSMDKWRMDEETGNIQHEAGRFFTVLGARVRRRHRFDEQVWDQPYIDQPEVGILGILAAEFGGVLHFCLQAKEEPGNVNAVQLSPTVQATFSNYTRSHGGTLPPLVGLFMDPDPKDILFSRLQTEDGGRFLYKSNRNMIVRCDPATVDVPSGRYIWLTLRQITALLRRDNVVNACARSVLSCLLNAGAICRSDLARALRAAGLDEDAGAWRGDDRAVRARCGPTPRDLFDWYDTQKAITHMHVKRVPLASLWDWHINRAGHYVHRKNRFFRVIGIHVESEDREVNAWTQPILENPREGVIGLLIRNVRGCTQVLLQAKAEPGNRPVVQIAPTVQFTPANYIDNVSLRRPFLFNEFRRPRLGRIIAESRQSEEGARFYREVHLHRIIEMPGEVELDLPEDYQWFTLEAVHLYMHLGEKLNSCARSILACLL